MAENVQGGLALPTDNITEAADAARDPWQVPEWKVSGIFASHMVLQRDMPISVWGWCDHPGTVVRGTWDGETVTSSVDANGRFALTFSPRAASQAPTEMTVSSDFGTTVFTDILVGDVWLVGGQSTLTQEALGPSEVWLDAPGDPSLGEDMCSASHFALITAYGDIKERLGGLERENATLRRRLKVYEIKVRTWG